MPGAPPVTASTVQTGSRPVSAPGTLCFVEAETTMSGNTDYQLPVWAHRVRKSWIARLYRSCGEGLLDEELIDAVGFALYARCVSMLQVTEAVHGRPPCPRCGSSAQVRKLGTLGAPSRP